MGLSWFGRSLRTLLDDAMILSGCGVGGGNYRIAWCRTYLKGSGYLTNSSRGVWSITDAGRGATEADMAMVETRYRALHPPKRAARLRRGDDPLTEDAEAEEEAHPLGGRRCSSASST
jgi:restriction endonuclease Mrr